MDPIFRNLPIGYKFRPNDYDISDYFLKKKALGQPMKTCTVPEECHDIIFSKHPRQLPGYPRQEHWYYYGRKRNNQVTANSYNLWTPIEEESYVFDKKNNGQVVGIKRPFTLVEKEEEESDSSKYKWFLDEISLPLTIADTDWVFYHIFGEKIEPEFVESESEDEEEEESVDI